MKQLLSNELARLMYSCLTIDDGDFFIRYNIYEQKSILNK